MVTSIVSSLGGGSGLDVAKLVDDLASASRTPKAQMFTQRLQAVQSKISAVAQARSDLESFATSLTGLAAGGTLQTQPTPSDPAALSAVAAPGAPVGALSSEIVIGQLARAQTSYSAYVADATASLGQGSMTLTVGGTDHAITLDASNDSLNGLAAAINASGAGVTASVLSDTKGARLVLRGQSGAANAFTLTSSDSGLQGFTTGAMTLGQAAQDAEFTLDGVAYARPANSVSDVLAGVTLTLRKAAPGTPVAITSTRPTDALRQTVQDFVSVYNTLKKDVASATTATGGDGALRSFNAQLSGLLATTLTSDPTIRTLGDIGLATTRDGTVSLDTAKLEAALKSHPDAVGALFSPGTDPANLGIAKAIQQLNDSATASNGLLAGLSSRLSKESASITSDQAKMEEREAAYKARLEQQFGTLDSRMSSLKATQSYLEQQVKVWTGNQ
ncbi:flagellar hook-associated 2-like protein [Sphingomonas ginkgonis]|uniref:Flagellar hook-associated protein 2 n=1 Tax=Sphingomonas ginkgonis TaxID=2315330 RepID=A0A429VCE3_9SPHN|nr:flagellar filament capping protein FliD [Sphingomonas ginkgonis]RST31557.1 flagellar hook-associated 2-like protein [Sphingomonas ginkgonis]